MHHHSVKHGCRWVHYQSISEPGVHTVSQHPGPHSENLCYIPLPYIHTSAKTAAQETPANPKCCGLATPRWLMVQYKALRGANRPCRWLYVEQVCQTHMPQTIMDTHRFIMGWSQNHAKDVQPRWVVIDRHGPCSSKQLSHLRGERARGKDVAGRRR